MIVGILGGGQLAQMLAQAASTLNIKCRVLDPSPEAPAKKVAEHICADYADPEALAKLIDGIDFLTYEFENIPTAALEFLPDTLQIAPHPRALFATQDRLREKNLFNSLGIRTAEFRPVSSVAELALAASELGFPSVLKTRSMGYDGKGQFVLKSENDIQTAFDTLDSTELILEGFVTFERELSIIGVRDNSGSTRCYPLVENIHKDGILRTSLAPALEVSTVQQELAEDYFRRLTTELDYVGVLCIELFATSENLLANEYAPRVHNSGHWTIEGANSSQFENHIRAVCSMPLGDTSVVKHSVMINIIGSMPDPEKLAAVEGIQVHNYGKLPRPGRKLGHITVCDSNPAKLEEKRIILEALCA